MADADPLYEGSLAKGLPVVGIDEVGRGPLAGPVVAAAAFLPADAAITGLRDSKKLSEKRRIALTQLLRERARIAFGAVSAAKIDMIGIEEATKTAMRLAAARLLSDVPSSAIIIVDGNRAPDFGQRTTIAEIKADGSCPSVAAASIAAKTLRDRYMIHLAARFDGYHWHTNKGYGSAAHREAIAALGPTKFHRRSFLRGILGDQKAKAV